jgi:hypothetical protein
MINYTPKPYGIKRETPPYLKEGGKIKELLQQRF